MTTGTIKPHLEAATNFIPINTLNSHHAACMCYLYVLYYSTSCWLLFLLAFLIYHSGISNDHSTSLFSSFNVHDLYEWWAQTGTVYFTAQWSSLHRQWLGRTEKAACASQYVVGNANIVTIHSSNCLLLFYLGQEVELIYFTQMIDAVHLF